MAPYRGSSPDKGREFDIAVEPRITTNDMWVMVRTACAGGGVTFGVEETFQTISRAGRMVSLMEEYLPAFPDSFSTFPIVAISHRSCGRLSTTFATRGVSLANQSFTDTPSTSRTTNRVKHRHLGEYGVSKLGDGRLAQRPRYPLLHCEGSRTRRGKQRTLRPDHPRASGGALHSIAYASGIERRFGSYRVKVPLQSGHAHPCDLGQGIC